jgi:prepilin-type N-terminal cleavage/methylation domain-containing protein
MNNKLLVSWLLVISKNKISTNNEPITNNQKGFTLIELMVVIAIIALLATIGFVAYGQTQIAARDSKRMQDIQAAQKAVETYRIANGIYPINTGNLSNISGLGSYFQGGVVPKDPKDDGITTTFVYRSYWCATAPKYAICAQLENPTGKANNGSVSLDSDTACTFNYASPPSGTHYCITN